MIRENTRLKNRIKQQKCPLCNNGEKIPDAVEKKIKREAEEKER